MLLYSHSVHTVVIDKKLMGKKRIEEHPKSKCRATHKTHREQTKQRREDGRRARRRRDGCRQEEVELQNAERMAAELEDAGPTHPRRKLQTKTESPHSNRISVDIMMTVWRTLVNRRHEGMLDVWA
jgi:arylamine N-acetyltransferase